MQKKLVFKKMNNSRGASLTELLAVVLILSLVTVTIAGGLTIVRNAYLGITLKAEAETAMSTIITKVSDELRFASNIDGGAQLTFESGIRGCRISMENITDEQGKAVNIGVRAVQGTAGAIGTPKAEPIVSPKTLPDGLAAAIKLDYIGESFSATVTLEQSDKIIAEQSICVKPIN